MLSRTRLKVFTSPLNPHAPELADKDGYGVTSYKGVAGPGTVFEAGKKIRITDITDGTSNTIAVVESGDPIPWAKPGDLVIDPKQPLPNLASPGLKDLFLAGMCDGAVRVISSTIPEKQLRALFT